MDLIDQVISHAKTNAEAAQGRDRDTWAAHERSRENAELRAALKRSMIAIDDWLNNYAPDLCDEARLAETETRIAEMGTLAYIAEVQRQNRAALEQKADKS